MANLRVARLLGACAVAAATGTAVPAQEVGDMRPVSVALTWLETTSDDHAGDYLAFLIRSYGCVVPEAEQGIFSEAVLAHIQADFGVAPATAEAREAAETALWRGLYDFGQRAGAHLVETGRLSVDAEGTAELTQCNMLTS